MEDDRWMKVYRGAIQRKEIEYFHIQSLFLYCKSRKEKERECEQ